MAYHDFTNDSFTLSQAMGDLNLQSSSSEPSSCPEQLCAVCNQIDVRALLTQTRDFSIDDQYHLGPLRDILHKTFCPGCRLIAHACSLSKPIEEQAGQLVDLTSDTLVKLRLRKITRFGVINSISATLWTGMRMISVMISDASNGEIETGSIFKKGELVQFGPEPWELETAGIEPDSSALIEGVQSWGALLSAEISDRADINQVRQWVELCTEQHPGCRPTPSTQKERIMTHQKIRLVDVEESRIVESSLQESYAALSYVWGSASPLLTRETIPRLSQNNCLGQVDIPRTISDAMNLVRDLGMRYLWVDSLCIVQDDFEDKQQQLSIMDRIYSSASIVIIAAAGGGAAAGLPGFSETPRRRSHLVETVGGLDILTCPSDVGPAADRSTWKTRGWTFQELYCARRVLVVTDGLVYWCCQEANWREDVALLSPDAAGWDCSEKSIWGRSPRTCRTTFFCSQVCDFASRSFSDRSDSLRAMTGVLKHMGLRFPRRFIWAHPYEQLDATLLWRKSTARRHIHRRSLPHSGLRIEGRHHRLVCPSWSWLSAETGVTFPDSCGSSTLSEVSWHDPLLLGDDAIAAEYIEAMFSRDSKEEIDIKGALEMSGKFPNLDFGLLHFTCRTARVRIVREEVMEGHDTEEDRNGEDVSSGVRQGSPDPFVAVGRIYSPLGECISRLTVPLDFFHGQRETLGELLLMSSVAEKVTDESCQSDEMEFDCGSIRHVSGCRHITGRNFMLIERRGSIAYRVNVGTMNRRDWYSLETREETIVLG